MFTKTEQIYSWTETEIVKLSNFNQSKYNIKFWMTRWYKRKITNSTENIKETQMLMADIQIL